MFFSRKAKNDDIPNVQDLIDETVTDLLKSDYTPTDPEFKIYCDRLEQLHSMKDTNKSQRVSNDTLVLVGANLVGIVAILSFEHVGPITSKALGFVTKLKL